MYSGGGEIAKGPPEGPSINGGPPCTTNIADYAIVQSFLDSLNYYNRFIEDYAVYACIICELREVDFQARRNQLKNEHHAPVNEEKEEEWFRVQFAFDMLNNKISTAPILRHFGPFKEAVTFVYASE